MTEKFQALWALRSIPKLLQALWLVALCSMLQIGNANAQTMDYNLNQAKRSLDQISTGIQSLRQNDINGYNRLSSKLTKAAELLQGSESTEHPEFLPAVQRWQQLQQQMVQIASVMQAEQAKQQQARQQQQQASSSVEKTQEKAAVAPVNLDPLMTKYQRQSLPKLAADASTSDARDWAIHMRDLQTTLLQADLATIELALASGAASAEDARRVRLWISDNFQRTIAEQILAAVQTNDGVIVNGGHTAELILEIDASDKNRVYQFAGEANGKRNSDTLESAVHAGAVAQVFDEIIGSKTNPERVAILEQIKSARDRLSDLKPIAAEQAVAIANAPKKQRVVKKDFLAPIAQEFWLNGGVLAESDQEGGIWIDSNQAGDITHNGEIWIESNERGSIEIDGEVWFDGYSVGSLEPNGEVWRNGSQVGLIEQNGTVWVGSSPAGEIVPFQGEWKRAAVLYYFSDFFAE